MSTIHLKKNFKKVNFGLVIFYTGDGKGKTTAALGLALRAINSGLRVIMLQFLKSQQASGEVTIPQTLPALKVLSFGLGFVNPSLSQNFKQNKLKVRQGLEYAQKMIKNKKYDIIILDEINVALNLKLATQSAVIKLIKLSRHSRHVVHLVLTGRGCPESLYKYADLVTEMQEIKHPFQVGCLAVKGIDY